MEQVVVRKTELRGPRHWLEAVECLRRLAAYARTSGFIHSKWVDDEKRTGTAGEAALGSVGDVAGSVNTLT